MDTTPHPQELLDKAKEIYSSGDFSVAAETFKQARQAFLDAGDTLMAAEMQNNQAVALLRAKQPQDALDILKGSDQTFAQVGDFRREGMALANIATAMQALKRHGEAIDYYGKAGESLQKAGEDELRLDVMQQLAMLNLRRFKFYDAVLALQSGLTGVKNPTARQRFMKKILFIRI